MDRKSKKADKNKNTELKELQPESVDAADNITIKNKKSKKRKHNNKSLDIINENQGVEEQTFIDEPLNKETKLKTIKKLKQSEISEDQKTSDICKKSKKKDHREETQKQKTFNKKDKVKNENKMKPNDQIKSDKNKKIIFEVDAGESVEVSKNNFDKNESDLHEEDVKDEDIDQFCDDITEEDNVQYENWVQLIEAKLKSNKSKPKT